MIMNYKNYKILIAFTILIIVIPKVQSQNNFVSTGANISGSGGTLSYSLGQLAYSTINGLSGSINQGVQQPYEIYKVGIEDVNLNISLLIYPNPTYENLVIRMEEFESNNFNYQLVDLHGKLLISNKILDRQTIIDAGILPPSAYLLKIIQDSKTIGSFKIIKN